MSAFYEAVLPVLMVFTIGFIVQKIKKVDLKAISTISIYIFIPALVFRSIYETEFQQQHLILVVVVFLLTVITILLIKGIAKLKKLDKGKENVFILATIFMNAGNYGSPVILFVLGEEAFHYAISFYVLQVILFNTLGVYYASKETSDLKKGLLKVLRLPAIYAVMIALVLKQFPNLLPSNIMTSVDLLADGAIPIIMLILGMQIANLELTAISWKEISLVTVIRLLISPIIVLGLTMILPIETLYRNVLIILAAMPTAVNATVYALEFDGNAKFVSVATLVNTIISFITISILLTILL
ncbi:AEC family transporter [Oceanobacillus kapialis]|uniref:AEC family transporter n=1 Tax=Oceanobacillus kapialis TaxID=481353 RepID=UPI003850FF30